MTDQDKLALIQEIIDNLSIRIETGSSSDFYGQNKEIKISVSLTYKDEVICSNYDTFSVG